MLKVIIKFFLVHKLVTVLLVVLLAGWGIVTATFDSSNAPTIVIMKSEADMLRPDVRCRVRAFDTSVI